MEAAELAEIFQWMTPEESAATGAQPETRQRLEDEIANVLLYLVQVADKPGVDIEAAVQRRIVKNALKYPAP